MTSAISGSAPGRRGSLFSIPTLWKVLLFDVPFFCLKCHQKKRKTKQKKNSPTTSDPKIFMVFTTKKGLDPFVYRTMPKNQLIRSVRLLNSAGGVLLCNSSCANVFIMRLSQFYPCIVLPCAISPLLTPWPEFHVCLLVTWVNLFNDVIFLSACWYFGRVCPVREERWTRTREQWDGTYFLSGVP